MATVAMNDDKTTASIPVLCRLNLHHRWHYVTDAEDNHRYRRCALCGKDDPHLGDPGIIYAPKEPPEQGR
jgi:hypothetical protein